MQKKRGQAGTECGRSEATGKELALALAIVVRRRAVRGRRGTSPRGPVWQVPSGATTFLLTFPSFCSILPAFFLVEQSSLFSLFSFFLFISQWHSPFPRAGSNLFVSRWQHSIPTALCSLIPPSNKAPLADRHTDYLILEMGNFIWHEHARYVAITASVCTLALRLN